MSQLDKYEQSRSDELITRVYEELELPNWAPWLAYSHGELQGQDETFPGGQFIEWDQHRQLLGALSTNRIDWDGNAKSLPHWDDIAGIDFTYRDTYKRQGNTLAFMSMSIAADAKGKGTASKLVKQALEFAQDEEIEHVIGDFRPSNYGEYKQQTGKFDFNEYIGMLRDDGAPYDGWIRSLDRMGMQPLSVDSRAMVIPETIEKFDTYRLEYKPENWWLVEDQAATRHLIDFYLPLHDIERVDEIWECGETGTWFVDRINEKAVYIEANMWGELPIPCDESIDHVRVDESSPDRSTILIGRRAVASMIMAFEFGPWNEALRFGLAAMAQAKGESPVVVAGVLGLSTLVTEGLSAVAAADLLDSKFATNWMQKINKYAEKRGIGPDIKVSTATKIAATYLGGSAVLGVINKTENPDITLRENIVQGLKASLGLSGVLAIQGYAVSKGISYPEPETIAMATLSVASILALIKMASKRVESKEALHSQE